ncbi:MAG: MucR family transcriptional regulator [Pseudomonadota bacterium]
MSNQNDEIAEVTTDNSYLIETVSDIVSAYVGNNPVPVGDLPGLIENIYNVVSELNHGGSAEPKEDLKPAVPVRRSVTDDYIICLEDGKKFKSLKRHLRTRYDMSPDDYRDKWGLPADYPMVAPNYAKQRSELAKRMGLGQAKK